MSYTITERCIGCGRCESECPTGAIQAIESAYRIDSQQCHSCSSYSKALCATVCPVQEACVPLLRDYWDIWFDRYRHLKRRVTDRSNTTYWDRWFGLFGETVTRIAQE